MGLLVLSGVIGIFVGDTALFACMNRLEATPFGPAVATHRCSRWCWRRCSLDESLVERLGCARRRAAGGRRDGRHCWQARGRAAHPPGNHAEPTGWAWRWGCSSALGQSVGTLVLKPAMAAGGWNRWLLRPCG